MSTQNDRKFDITMWPSRKSKKGKNRKMSWSELIDYLSSPVRTNETMAEYKVMSKDEQGERKDVGAFTGGYCKNGVRSNVSHRSVLALDADFADNDLWVDWAVKYGKAAVVYSTHKHTPENPRLRIIVPLARDVSPEEYIPIGRRVAADLGIDKFDDTTFSPSRIMYLSSYSRDAEFFVDHLNGPFLDPDEVLASYHDWRDVSSWPMSSRVMEVVKRTAARQQDPLTKPGVVGAFCRTYSIREAIETFVPEYVPCDEPSRYTYAEGSTAAGVVVYDDKYTYSFHATDPATGQLCNAWDLVRIHRYHELDKDCEPGTPTTSLPSYKAMQELADGDGKVKIQLLEDRKADFEVLPEEDDDKWQERLKFTKQGIAQSIDNAVIILNHDPELKNRLAKNELSQNIDVLESLFWRKEYNNGPWTDDDDAQLLYYMEKVYGLTSQKSIDKAITVVAGDRSFHPIRQYLDKCEWDGVPRVDTLLVDCLGAEDNEYTRAVTRKTLTAAVARVYEPGCVFQYVLTLKGEQGIGKSELPKRLAGPWFSDSLYTMQGKDSYEQVQGKWIIEISELDSMKKAEVTTVKTFITKQTDCFRPAYARRQQEFPRQCVFFGTTNEGQFLRDTTGNRRWWIVDTPNAIPRKMLPALKALDPKTVSLIWGEAKMYYEKGEPLFLPDDLEESAQEIQKAFEEENPKEGRIREYLDRPLPENWNSMDLYDRRNWLDGDEQGTVVRDTVCTLEIYAEALGGNPDKFTRYDGMEIRGILANLPEWKYRGNRIKLCKPYGKQRYYARCVND